MNCFVCGKPVPILSGTKLKNGHVCQSCLSKIPSLFLKMTKDWSSYSLLNAMEYVDEKYKQFCATASYGKLHIDEIHGLFAISNELNKDGKPKSGKNVFSVYDLSEVGLCCTSPKSNRGLVSADIELTFKMENPIFICKTLIRRNVKCQSKRADGQYVEWREPSDLLMFKTLFNNMLFGAAEQVNSILCGKTIHEFEIEKARAIFMLPENYTDADLKKARKLMLKVYHPDNTDEDVTREAQIINKAYILLKAEQDNKEE